MRYRERLQIKWFYDYERDILTDSIDIKNMVTLCRKWTYAIKLENVDKMYKFLGKHTKANTGIKNSEKFIY